MVGIDLSAHAITERLLDWLEQATHAGRRCRADALLLLAWCAYDRPPRQVRSPPISPVRLNVASCVRKAKDAPSGSGRKGGNA
jgi:hypothetical protein